MGQSRNEAANLW